MAIPAPKEWYYARNDQPVGPITTERLRELLRSGEVPPSTLITPAPTYLPAAEYPELSLHLPVSIEPNPTDQPIQQTHAAPTASKATNIETPAAPVTYYADMTSSLLKSGPWIRFLSILSYIGGALYLFGGLCIGIVVGSGIKLGAPADLSLALGAQFRFWRYLSISLIVIIALSLLIGFISVIVTMPRV